MPTDTNRGYTTADLAARWRVSPDKVRNWIEHGELAAISTSLTRCGKPRYIVTPESVEQFERGRAVIPPPKPAKRRQRNQEVDYYPD